MSNSVGSGRQRRRWLWWSGAIVGLLLLAVIVFHAVVPAVAGRVAGRVPGVPASGESIDLSILRESLVVEGVRMSPARHTKRIEGVLTGMLTEDFPPILTASAESER